MASKYEILVNILDKIVNEAPSSEKTYHASSGEERNRARSLGLIHLFLKSKFGLMTFKERNQYVTDGGGDGGIDAYYFDHSRKVLSIIQSKFRTTEKNFEEKLIDSNELSAIDLQRIDKGEECSEQGIAYNGKIKGFQRALSEIPDLPRWDYKVIILANVKDLKDESIKRLVGGYQYEIYNYARVYKEMVLPICSGQYFEAESISLEIETVDAQKTEVNQTISTDSGDFQVRLIFIPALEIARSVTRYKNSLMKYNPRNFLSFKSNKVNDEIRESVVGRKDNLLAILNNGITFIASADSFTDRTGRKGVGKLVIEQPQIINGGQTAYALAVIYENSALRNHLEGKSVLAKIITPSEDGQKIPNSLIEKISFANNRQSKIVEADQRSNSDKLISLQEYFFEFHGLLFERKRGEFYEGLDLKYIDKKSVINRVELLKAALAYKGQPSRARVSQDTLFEEDVFDEIVDGLSSEELALSYLLRKSIKETVSLKGKSPFGIIAAFGMSVDRGIVNSSNLEAIASQVKNIEKEWISFEQWAVSSEHNSKYVSGTSLLDTYFKGSTFNNDIVQYFSTNKLTINI